MSHEPSAVRCEGTTRRGPILFLDVDGVIIPYGGAETAPDSATVALFGPEADEDHLSRIDPEHGPRLSELECSLVWATGWEDDANDVISPRVGLPRLPVVAWSSHRRPYRSHRRRHRRHRRLADRTAHTALSGGGETRWYAAAVSCRRRASWPRSLT